MYTRIPAFMANDLDKPARWSGNSPTLRAASLSCADYLTAPVCEVGKIKVGDDGWRRGGGFCGAFASLSPPAAANSVIAEQVETSMVKQSPAEE